MARVNWRFVTYVRCFLDTMWLFYNVVKLTFLSFFHNDFADWYYIGDTLMEPMFWFVDHFTKILGPICVVGVLLLSSSIVVISYIIGLPFYIRWNSYVLTIALIIGHWLLINLIFYYCMAYTTEPGYPPQGAIITEAISICKRCIAPKPPRTHHCSVCNRCILKMDHHCPWLNNCIGHFNHRYFFVFCIYAWCGVVFIMVFGIPVGYDHFFVEAEHSQLHYHNISLYAVDDGRKAKWTAALYHSCIIYVSLLSVAVFFVLGGLIAWHARLISNGETSVEYHINKKERARFKKENKVYKNPYDFGPVKNWKMFLRIGEHRPWWHILLPFAEGPPGDGLQWNYYNHIENDHTDLKHETSRICSVKIT